MTSTKRRLFWAQYTGDLWREKEPGGLLGALSHMEVAPYDEVAREYGPLVELVVKNEQRQQR